MKLFKSHNRIAYIQHLHWYSKSIPDWDELINRTNLYNFLIGDLANWTQLDDKPVDDFLAPIGSQEVWAAGVTYLRSKIARMEEAESAGGGDFYDKVYNADRPELFFKSTPYRTVGPNQSVFIRRDSTWNVPEPELTLFISAEGTIEGYTIGNDMSSRSIEGENPLYLPQAKSYDRSASIGPCLYLSPVPISLSSKIVMSIHRRGDQIYHGSVAINQMKRSLNELVSYLYRECSFPVGCFLMTGTCLVPEDDFTLEVDDVIKISIDRIGELINTVGIKPD